MTLRILTQMNDCMGRPFYKPGNLEEIKVRGEGSKWSHFRQVELRHLRNIQHSGKRSARGQGVGSY